MQGVLEKLAAKGLPVCGNRSRVRDGFCNAFLPNPVHGFKVVGRELADGGLTNYRHSRR